jgi:phosphoribosylanthranilate isomerase
LPALPRQQTIQLDPQLLTATMHNRQCLAQQHYLHKTHMFRIKICGITEREDAIVAIEAGADAIGFNFFTGSKRCINYVVAAEIAQKEGHSCTKVGVFVNHSAEDVNSMAEAFELDAVQLHGDQPPSYLLDVERRFPILRVFRVDASGFIKIKADLLMCAKMGRSPDAVLIDAVAPGEFGGTGRQLDWNTLADRVELLNFDRTEPVRLILAGGLTPENVAEAIRLVRPYGVDVASGVEVSPGRKDAEKVKAFVAEAKRGFAEIGFE